MAPERLARWMDGFGERHGGAVTVASDLQVELIGADGARAVCVAPFPPVEGDLVTHALRDRRVGVLLVRLGGYAAGVFEGARLVSSKVGSRQVHGRSAAGGQSQQRFARRREGQAAVALRAAADNAVRILLPEVSRLDAVVTGGDRGALAAVLADDRLAALRPLVLERVIDVPEPRQAVLLTMPQRFRAVRITLTEPPNEPPTRP
ncbi:MAG TPA: acVLRF1 family peptidyl-tRNA hydrolase [Mycobacteriales bacterium]|nr:acVLRF1 family peptidyl-tRNA hydrolase [Mycobacteriales bacterium]